MLVTVECWRRCLVELQVHQDARCCHLPPSPFMGTWVMAPEAGSLGVGPAEFDVSWWNGDDGVIAARWACYYDDEYIFNPDGSFRSVEAQGETWVEGWQGAEADACGSGIPVAPHDGSIELPLGLTIKAQAPLQLPVNVSYVGLPKAVNGAEIGSPADAVTADQHHLQRLSSGGWLCACHSRSRCWRLVELQAS